MLNADYKILVTTLVNRVSSIVEPCVHKDQVGFIHGRYLKNNIVSKAQLDSVPRVLFLDVEMAFDHIEWTFAYRI